MKNKFFFSIIIPTYNSDEYIIDTIQSIINQTFSDYEIIIIDDNSMKFDFEIIKNFIPKEISLKIHINKENKGPNFSRNLGIKISEGKYIIFLDSDDRIDKELLKNLKCEIDNDVEYEIIDFKFKFFEKNKVIYKSKLQNKLIYKNHLDRFLNGEIYTVCWNKAYKKKFLEENRIKFIEDKVHGRDAIFTFDCFKNVKSYTSINKFLYYSIYRNSSFSRNFSIRNIKSLNDNINEIIKRCEENSFENRTIQNYIFKHFKYIFIVASFRIPLKEYKDSLKYFKSTKNFNMIKKNVLSNKSISKKFYFILISNPSILYIITHLFKFFKIKPY